MLLKALLKKAQDSVCLHISDILDETPMTENSLHVQLHDYIDMGKITTTDLPANCLAELTSECLVAKGLNRRQSVRLDVWMSLRRVGARAQ